MVDKSMPSPKKKLGENIFGTSIRKAEGAKTVRPGDADTTGAKREKAPFDAPRFKFADRKTMQEADKKHGEAASALTKRGYRTGTEQRILDKLKPKGKSV